MFKQYRIRKQILKLEKKVFSDHVRPLVESYSDEIPRDLRRVFYARALYHTTKFGSENYLSVLKDYVKAKVTPLVKA